MPVMDGFDSIPLIRNGKAGREIMDIPVIVVSADITESTKRQVLRLGANDFKTEPIQGDFY